MSVEKVDIQKILNLKIDQLNFMKGLKKILYSHGIYTIGDLTKKTESELLQLFPANGDDTLIRDCFIMDIECMLEDLGLSLANEDDGAEDPYHMLLEENEALKKENVFLKKMVRYLAKEMVEG